MNKKVIKLFKEEWFSVDQDLDTQKYYLSIPVFNGYAQYDEDYELLPDEFEALMKNEAALRALVQKCRDRKNDARLRLKPGRIRGYPLT